MDINNSSALVTGAASGLGAATAAMLAARGVRVIGVDLPAGISKAPAVEGVTYVPADVTDAEQVRAAVAAAGEAGPLRMAVNCAGIAPSARILGRNGSHDLGMFETVVRVNLIGTFTVMTLAAEAMAQTDPVDEDVQRGLIVNTASVAAFEGQVGQAAYAASKGGVHSLTITAARDLASFGIRVNTIAPGILETPMLATVGEDYRAGLAAGVPFPARLGRPEEYAQLVGSLLDSDYLNGATVRLDGALRMAPR
ncbi:MULTISPECIES: SDR family NAD(P)-dependent oxidoreductase [Citricoccus]|uniref:SDR family NAD(P)-dependent oxidoreductase n=2 Tax=Citricoccus parietis TaxID=592307 RepID=A0ABV5G840_9MICC|nr:SDR family NAD(P)-dependent oxidoreductase [Citricoccus sp. K5]VXC21086.1 3-hydroxyacyl-CoA dehydrogenase [Citricoccus sp. K5]